MTNNNSNKIEAIHKNLSDILSKQKYQVDYFQREYAWTKNNMEELVTDLTSAFLSDYKEGHERKIGANYNNYYLGPFVIGNSSNANSIVDGQQRLTSILLFFMYLNHLHPKAGLENLIFTEIRGYKSFVITDQDREKCFNALFTNGFYTLQDNDSASVRNMTERYLEIDEFFPDELKNNSKALTMFIDWVQLNVILVQITAYSEDNAYSIFETMNDRGLSLTSSEMLKGFLLSTLEDHNGIREAKEQLWKRTMLKLDGYGKEEQQRFFQAWFRAQYAQTMRKKKAGASREDFELIGTRFHSWFRDNLKKIPIDSNEDFVEFLDKDFTFFSKTYLKILHAEQCFQENLEYVYYIKRFGIAPNLALPLMLAPLCPSDSEELITQKINLVARYIENFAIRRAFNFHSYSSSTVRTSIYNLVKEIRRTEYQKLKELLSEKLTEMSDDTLEGVLNFRLHGKNKPFVKFLLSRITGWLEKQVGTSLNFANFFETSKGRKPFEIEHIWANHHARHQEELPQENDFQEFRNRLGDLILLPKGTNQSFKDCSYEAKRPHYIKENILVKSLCDESYEKNPNFLKATKELSFKPHQHFKKNDILERQELYKRICEQIWSDTLE